MSTHGTAKRYSHGPDEDGVEGRGCRCGRCTEAVRLERRRQRAVGPQTVSSVQARRALRKLQSYGWTRTSICAELGLGAQQNLLKYARCTRTTSDAVLGLLADVERIRRAERRNLPFEPLETVIAAPALAEKLGIHRTAVLHWRHRGVPGRRADAAAVAAGYHPSVIWPDYFEEAA